MQNGPWLPATASISAYESVLILASYYKAFCLKLEPLVTAHDDLPESAGLLLRESVALGETLAQVLDALDSDLTTSPNACIKPGEIVVSLTDALLLMCQVQKSVAPLIDIDASQNDGRHAQWEGKHEEIAYIAQGLKKQSTAFGFQLAMLSW